MHAPEFWILVLVAQLVILPLNSLAAERPNVLVILTDDQGWGDLSLNGNTSLATPHIDSLARDGASFDRFYVGPVCSPTRAEFLTGRYYPRTGVHGVTRGAERMDLDETTIADVFKAAGYATAVFGKWHNGAQYPYHPNGRGFDEFYGFTSGHWGDYFSPPLDHNGQLVRGNGYVTDDFTDKALRFIEQHRDQVVRGSPPVVRGSPDPALGGAVGRPATTPHRDRPFFAYVAYNAPHSPMQVPDHWWNKFKSKDIALRGTQPQQENIDHTRAALAMCENIDWNVGRILSRLDELSIADNTIVVYFCDNGPNGHRWNAGLRGIKGSTDEGGLRSPLLVRWPLSIARGTRVAQIAGAIDLLPTLTELAEIPIAGNKQLDGLSLKPLLVGRGLAHFAESSEQNVPVPLPEDDSKSDPLPPKLRDRLLFSHWNGRVSVGTNRFRLDDAGKLYDLLRDPGQQTNVSKQHPKIKARLQAAVEAWKNDMLAELDNDDRPFLVGHPDATTTHLPAADGVPHGNVRWSSKHPNSSYFTDWKNVDDRISWDVEVMEPGEYDVEILYTCPAADVGSTIEITFDDRRLSAEISEPHDPPLRGAEHDRVPRSESYVKDFRPMKLGTIRLEKGRGELMLRALKVPGSQVMEFQLLRLTRTDN